MTLPGQARRLTRVPRTTTASGAMTPRRRPHLPRLPPSALPCCLLVSHGVRHQSRHAAACLGRRRSSLAHSRSRRSHSRPPRQLSRERCKWRARRRLAPALDRPEAGRLVLRLDQRGKGRRRQESHRSRPQCPSRASARRRRASVHHRRARAHRRAHAARLRPREAPRPRAREAPHPRAHEEHPDPLRIRWALLRSSRSGARHHQRSVRFTTDVYIPCSSVPQSVVYVYDASRIVNMESTRSRVSLDST